MKFQILNNEELGFFDDNGNKTATIKISGSNNLVLNPSGSGDIILGDNDTVNDIEIGIPSTPSNMTFLGGGTITSNGATLNIGDPTNNDTIILNSPTLISGSVSLDSSITASYISASNNIFASTYYGDGSNLTGIETDPFPYTGSAVISGSLEVIGTQRSLYTTQSFQYSGSNLTQITMSFENGGQEITNINYTGSNIDNIVISGSDGINKIYTLSYDGDGNITNIIVS